MGTPFQLSLSPEPDFWHWAIPPSSHNVAGSLIYLEHDWKHLEKYILSVCVFYTYDTITKIDGLCCSEHCRCPLTLREKRHGPPTPMHPKTCFTWPCWLSLTSFCLFPLLWSHSASPLPLAQQAYLEAFELGGGWHCQLERVLNHPGDKLLSMFVKEFAVF